MSTDSNPESASTDFSLMLDGQTSPELLRRIVDSVADPIFVKDEQHRWIMVNQAVCDLMGHSRDALLGKSDFDFFPTEEAEVFWEKDKEVFDSGLTNINEEHLTDGEGRTRVIVTKKSILKDERGNKILVGVIRDITDLKQTEQALQQARDELEQKVEQRTAEVRKT